MEPDAPDPEYDAMLRDIAREEAAEHTLLRRLAAYVRAESARLHLDGAAKHLESQHTVTRARAVTEQSRKLIAESYRILLDLEATVDIRSK